MKKVSKLLALCIAVVIVAGTFCGCGGGKETREKNRF